MRCPMCGYEAPEGAKICTECGSRLSLGGRAEQQDDSVASFRNLAAAREDNAGRSFDDRIVVDAVGKLIRYRIITIVLGVIGLIFAFYIIGVLKHTSWYEYSKVEELSTRLTIYSIVAGVVGIVLNILVWFAFDKMKSVEPRFEKVCLYLIIVIVLDCIGLFTDNNIVNLAQSIVGIMYLYSYCMAMRDLCRPDHDIIADNWDWLWRVELAELIVTIAVGIYVVIKMFDASSLHAAMSSLETAAIIEGGITLVVAFLELRFLCRTRDAFARNSR